MPPASAGLLLGFLVNPEHGSNMKLQNTGISLNYTPLLLQNTVLFMVTIMRNSEPTEISEIHPRIMSGVTGHFTQAHGLHYRRTGERFLITVFKHKDLKKLKFTPVI
jgi:hypothetical protein